MGKLHPNRRVAGLAVLNVNGAQGIAVGSSPVAYAQDLCTDAHMKQMDDMIAR